MSGVGEALAIVSCVAGLIQAYDAGSRVVSQIKERRRAHGALPPSDRLEESIKKGKSEIQSIVADGNKRFGSSFEEGDPTAKLALLQITIAVQSALLDGLTRARDDDGVVDFERCIDTSDKGRVDALLALHELFKRKLEEEMSRKEARVATGSEEQKDKTSSPVHSQTDRLSSSALQPTPPAPTPSKTKKSRTFSDMFRLKSSIPENRIIEPAEAIGLASHPGPLSRTAQRKATSTAPDPPTLMSSGRRSTIGSTTSTISKQTSRPRVGTREYLSGLDPSLLPFQKAPPPPPPGSTRRSSTSGSTIAPITKYGGCCKYAYQLRDGKLLDALDPVPATFYSQTKLWRWQCKSKKCKFRGGRAVEGRNGRQNDTTVYRSFGLEFRWLFLAKSHVPHEEDTDHPPYRCLVCIMLGDESPIYRGTEALLTHVVRHRGAYLGDVRLKGPLIFTNAGVKADPDSGFDINLPEPNTPPITAAPDPRTPAMVEIELQNEGHTFDRDSKGSSLVSYDTDVVSLHTNPWATC